MSLTCPKWHWSGLSRKCNGEKPLDLYEKFHMEDIEPRGFPTAVYTPGSNKGLPFEANLLACPTDIPEGELFAYVWEAASIIATLCGGFSDNEALVRESPWESLSDFKRSGGGLRRPQSSQPIGREEQSACNRLRIDNSTRTT